MRVAYACEANTWGPRRRASTFAHDPRFTAVGTGTKVALLGPMKWRSVSWCKGSPLDGFDVVLGDPSCAALAPPDVPSIGVAIGGQDHSPSCGGSRELEALWDAEKFPLHPWGGRTDLPSREEVRSKLDPQVLDGPIIGVLPVSWARNLLIEVVREARPRHASSFILNNPEAMIGCDLVVCAAGWAPVLEARASGVPYAAVDLGRRDHWVRRTHDVRGASEAVYRVEKVDLDPERRPWLPDYSEALLGWVEARATSSPIHLPR